MNEQKKFEKYRVQLIEKINEIKYLTDCEMELISSNAEKGLRTVILSKGKKKYTFSTEREGEYYVWRYIESFYLQYGKPDSITIHDRRYVVDRTLLKGKYKKMDKEVLEAELEKKYGDLSKCPFAKHSFLMTYERENTELHFVDQCLMSIVNFEDTDFMNYSVKVKQISKDTEEYIDSLGKIGAVYIESEYKIERIKSNKLGVNNNERV